MSKVARVIVGAAMIVVGVVTGSWQLIVAGTMQIGSALLTPSMKQQQRQAAATTLQLGEVPRQGIVGRAATAGSLANAFNYGGKYGTDWEVLVLALADHECDALEGFYVNDVYVAFAGDGVVPGYNSQLEIYWRPGTESQTLPTVLTSQGGYAASDNGAGVCHVTVCYKADKPDAKNPIWPSGRPRFLWVLRGLKCYDAREDSTVAGGSGAHRWANPATREWSENPIVQRYTWSRGIYACNRVNDPGMLLIGRGLSATEQPPANVAARANICDESVALDAGGTEPRYRAGGVIRAEDPYLTIEEFFAAACGGEIAQPQGCVEIEPGRAKSPSFSFTDADLIVGSTAKGSDFLSEADDEWINTVIPRYVEPSQRWADHAAPIRRDEDDLIEDGGPREATLSLSLVTSATQAGRIGEIRRRLGRLAGRRQVTLGPRFAEVEEGDWGTWQSDRYFGGETRTFRVDSYGSDQKWHHTLQLRQISASCYAAGGDLDDGSVAAPQDPPPAIGAPDPGSWTLTAETLSGGDGAMPAIVVSGATDDGFARFVRIEYWRDDGVTDPEDVTDWESAGLFGPDVTRWPISSVAPGADYYAAVSYVVDNEVGDRLILGPVTAPSGPAGEPGTPGTSNVVVVLYQRTDSASAPALPDNNITVTFATGALSGSLDGWSATDPGIGSGFNRWETSAQAIGTGTSAAIIPSQWATPVISEAQNLSNSALTISFTGVPAAEDGTVDSGALAALGTQFVVKRDETDITSSASFSVVSETGGDVSINTATNTPVSGKPKGWVTVNSLSADLATFVLRATVGSKTVDRTYGVKKDRANPGDPGISTSLVRLFRRTTTSSAPAVPDNNITFTFEDNSLSGSLDGWSQTEPAVTAGPWLWETFAWAAGTDATYVITPAEWLATPNLLRIDDYRASTDATAFTVPAEADGTVDPGYLTALEGQLYFRTSTSVLVGPSNDTAGVTLSVVSAGGGTATINTANNTPVSGKPKGYFRITALAAGLGQTSVVFKATYGGIDYPTLPVVVTKALAGQEAYGLRLIPSRDRLTRDAWGRPSPASQTFTFTPERENFTAGTVTFEVRNAANVVIGGDPTYGTVSGGNFVMTDAQVIAAAGATRGIIVFMTDTGGGGKYAAAHVWTDGTLPAGDNEWPDPQLNTLDAYFAGGALTAPFSIQTNGAAANYKYNNYLRIVSTTTPTNEYFGKVFEKLPVRFAGETFYWGYTGGRGVGSGALGGGIYLIFRDIDGNQVGTTQKLFNTTAMTPTGDWPQVNGTPINAPADAAYVEGGYYRNAHGTITSSQYQIVNAYLSRSQPNSNNTEARQAKLEAPAENQIVSVTNDGTVKSFPTSLRCYRRQGDVDVSTTTAWSLTNVTNITASIGAATGVISISAVAGPAYFDVVSTRDNINLIKRIWFDWAFDPVPVGIGNTVSDSPLAAQASVSNTSYGSTPFIGPYPVMTGPTASLTFFCQLFASPNGNSGEMEVKPQYRTPPGSGTWTDAGMIVSTGTVPYSADNPAYGKLGATLALISGLSANTAYEVRWLARKASGLATSMQFTGGAAWVRGQ